MRKFICILLLIVIGMLSGCTNEEEIKVVRVVDELMYEDLIESEETIGVEEKEYLHIGDTFIFNEIEYKIVRLEKEYKDNQENGIYNLIIDVANNSEVDIQDVMSEIYEMLEIRGTTDTNSMATINNISESAEISLKSGEKAEVCLSYEIMNNWNELYISLGDEIYLIKQGEEIKKIITEKIEGRINTIIPLDNISYCITDLYSMNVGTQYDIEDKDGKRVLRFVLEVINNSDKGLDLSFIKTYMNIEALCISSKNVKLDIVAIKGFENLIGVGETKKGYIEVIAPLNWDTITINYKVETLNKVTDLVWTLYTANVMNQVKTEMVEIKEIKAKVNKTVTLAEIVCLLKNIEVKPNIEENAENVYVIAEFEIANKLNKKLDENLLYSDIYCRYKDDEDNFILAEEAGNSMQGNLEEKQSVIYKIIYELPKDWQELEIVYKPSYSENVEIHYNISKEDLIENLK